MKIRLPLPPNMANSRMHWRVKQKRRKEYELLCDVQPASHFPGPGVYTFPLPKARIRATLYVWSEMDGDNLMARLKWPVDWLVKNGYLVDDSPRHLEWEMPKQVVDRKDRRIEIELEEL